MQRTARPRAFWLELRGAVRDSARVFRKAPWLLLGAAMLMLLGESVFELVWLGGEVTVEAARGGSDVGPELMQAIAHDPAAVHIGLLVLALPFALVGVVVRAAVLHGYLLAQCSIDTDAWRAATTWKSCFPRLLVVELLSGLGLLASGVFGALPGTLLVLSRIRFLGGLGIVAAQAGAVAAVLYVLPGVAFASRFVVLGGLTARLALRESWRLAARRRAHLLAWLGAAYAMEALGLIGLLVVIVGALVSMPAARAFRDTVLTRVFLDLLRAQGWPGKVLNPAT